MASLDDIVLVSEEDFASTYSNKYFMENAVEELAFAGITFPIKYTSPFFRQLSALAMLVYIKGTISIVDEKKNGEEHAPTYAAQLFVGGKLDRGFVERKLAPYFTVSPANEIRVGLNGINRLNRPLARILHTLEIPTDSEHLEAAQLPTFMTELAAIYTGFRHSDERDLANRLLFDLCEAFFNVKVTFNHNFYWEFFLPVKKDRLTASRFRSDLLWLFRQVFPEITFKRLGKPSQRNGQQDGHSIVYYKSIISLQEEGTRALLSGYAKALDLEGVLRLNPKVNQFYLEARMHNGA